MVDRVFKEDFFERVIDVQWDEEKEVYWVAGDAQGATDSYGSAFYTSDDGMHWETHEVGFGGENYGKLWGHTSGLWMRERFDIDKEPIWILGGEGITADGTMRKSGIQISRDGLTFEPARFFDYRHFVAQFLVYPGGPTGYDLSLESVNFGHADTFHSVDGLSWTPQQYHADNPFSALQVSTPPLVTPTIQRIVPARTIPNDVPLDVPVIHAMEGAAPLPIAQMLAALAATATPTATPTKPVKKNYIYQLSNRTGATGRLRKGKYAGKSINMYGGTPHGFHGPGTGGADYFDPNCKMYDGKTGKLLGTSNCGIKYCHSMAYGYYVFVVAGGNQAGYSQLSYTEDGKNWNVQTFGKAQSMWSLVVGPRPNEPRKPPPGPPTDEEKPDVPPAPTGPTGPTGR